ncbi:hypothetical protein [Streptomyces yangpuensis]|uniref:hypothetical protein n=1 Tax=Streptomyces yangpuensis TaxID=1648182 RepID=UPI003712A811
MNSALRHTAVVALVELARSTHYEDRADAGHALAAFAGTPEAAGPLLELVLDRADTHVTRVTAHALLQRQDRAGLSLVASALAVAGPHHADWIHTALRDAFTVYATERDEAMRICEELAHDPDEHVASGARELHESLARIDCVLHPA